MVGSGVGGCEWHEKVVGRSGITSNPKKPDVLRDLLLTCVQEWPAHGSLHAIPQRESKRYWNAVLAGHVKNDSDLR